MTTEDKKIFRRQMFLTALGAMLIICLPAWGSIYWMRTKDHFQLENSVSQGEFLRFQLAMEQKARAWESVALANKQDIEHIDKAIQDLKDAQEEIDRLLIEEFRTRDMVQTLPEY